MSAGSRFTASPRKRATASAFSGVSSRGTG
uniref:Uncharacterized protein n=1 Tax=Human herpesvirus 1 TaxID=10298 RepID=A0A2Z4GZX4_HHV1|nr:hypothetical protein [Human alphaherpesvirus 1]